MCHLRTHAAQQLTRFSRHSRSSLHWVSWSLRPPPPSREHDRGENRKIRDFEPHQHDIDLRVGDEAFGDGLFAHLRKVRSIEAGAGASAFAHGEVPLHADFGQTGPDAVCHPGRDSTASAADLKTMPAGTNTGSLEKAEGPEIVEHVEARKALRGLNLRGVVEDVSCHGLGTPRRLRAARSGSFTC